MNNNNLWLETICQYFKMVFITFSVFKLIKNAKNRKYFGENLQNWQKMFLYLSPKQYFGYGTGLINIQNKIILYTVPT